MSDVAPFLLTDICVMVTRPAHQADGLCRRIEAEGGNVMRFPVIAIREPADPGRVAAVVDRLAEFEVAVFVSQNAVDWGMRLIQDREQSSTHLKIITIGPGTAAALHRYGVTNAVFPTEQANSEALLTLPELAPGAVNGQRILIFRGEGGPDFLGQELSVRGALVDYAEVYRRVRPVAKAATITDPGGLKSVDIIMTTSREGLLNLFNMIGKDTREQLLQIPLVLVSQRMVGLAKTLGFTSELLIATAASDEGLVEAVKAWSYTYKESEK